MASNSTESKPTTEQSDTVGCAICYEDLDGDKRAVLPCCGTAESSVQYCRRCIEIIVEGGTDGKIGRCPTCSSCIIIHNGVLEKSDQRAGRCRMCCQEKIIVDPSNNLCELCLLGGRFQFRYECARCHHIQSIPHPMWRYQASPEEFGSATWACHVGCGDYTIWRVTEEDVPQIPPELCPDSWGRRDEWLASVRAQRHVEQERSGVEEPEDGVRGSGLPQA